MLYIKFSELVYLRLKICKFLSTSPYFFLLTIVLLFCFYRFNFFYATYKSYYAFEVIISLKCCYKYRMFYINLMLTPKQKASVDIQKMRKKSKCTTIENYQITKNERKRGRKDKRDYKATREQ